MSDIVKMDKSEIIDELKQKDDLCSRQSEIIRRLREALLLIEAGTRKSEQVSAFPFLALEVCGVAARQALNLDADGCDKALRRIRKGLPE